MGVKTNLGIGAATLAGITAAAAALVTPGAFKSKFAEAFQSRKIEIRTACETYKPDTDKNIPVAKSRLTTGEIVTVSVPLNDTAGAREFFCQTPYQATVFFSNGINGKTFNPEKTFARDLAEMAVMLAAQPAGTVAKISATSPDINLAVISKDGIKELVNTSPYRKMDCIALPSEILGSTAISCETVSTAQIERTDLAERQSVWDHAKGLLQTVAMKFER